MNNSTYNLSIIIPHYNSPDTLKTLLETIGFHNDVEVIVVDDKSTVEWKNIITEFPNVCFLENKSIKKGPGVARNIGLDKASGQWVLFADSDDILVDGWYKLVSECFLSDNEIVFFPPDSVDIRTGDRNTKRGRWYSFLCTNYIETGDEELLRSKFSSPCSKLIKMSLINAYDLRFAEIMQCEDSMFSAKSGYYARSITAKLSPIYCINDHDGSLTTIVTEEAYRIRIDVLCEQYNFWKEKEGYEKSLEILRNDGLNFLFSRRQFGIKYLIHEFNYMRKGGVSISYYRLLKYCGKKVIHKILNAGK